MIRLCALFFLASTLVACGGGGGSDSSNSNSPLSPPQNNLPVITSASNVDILEGQTSVLDIAVTDEDGDAISLTLTGADANQFSLSGNTLSFNSVPDYEAPSSSAGTNSYSITLNANDGTGSVSQAVTINVLDATEGRVVDGPLSGAKVFLDLNGNLIQDANEIFVVTDANGYFKLPANTEANSQSDKLVAVGGTDISTGKSLPNMVLVSDIPTAEDASVVVTPVSTLIAAATTAADKQAVLTSLGITGSVEDVLTQDSWAQAQLGNQQAIAVQAANQAIAAVLQSATSLIDTSGADSTNNAANLIMSITEQLVTESVLGSDLFDESVLANVMEQGIEDYATDYEPSLDLDSQLFDSLASTLSTTIGIIQAVDNPTSAAANEIVAIVQDALQIDIAEVASSGNINNFINSTEPTSLFAGASSEVLIIVNLDTDGDGIINILDTDGQYTDDGIASNYCSTQIYHLNDDIHGSSGIYLTIENSGSDSLSVSIASADNSLVTQMLVESKTGASVETDSSAEPDTFTRVLSWSGTPPENETFDILWAKTSGGTWIVRDISVPTEATCNGNGGGGSQTTFTPVTPDTPNTTAVTVINCGTISLSLKFTLAIIYEFIKKGLEKSSPF